MHNVNAVVVLCSIFVYSYVHAQGHYDEDYWQGKWFPVPPGQLDVNQLVDPSVIDRLQNAKKDPQPQDLHDAKHGVKMGVSTSYCDDGKTNLTTDWDGLPDAYTCYERRAYSKNLNLSPIEHIDNIPKNYWATHACMNETIFYPDPIPTFGPHRPLWPKYGEYRYVPKQRWLHNLEHGALVMLYHPCADYRQVNKLKQIVKNCLYRHIITPYNLLSRDRPLALVTWGCRLTMNVVDKDIVSAFIRQHALKGPESLSRDGQYNIELIQPASYVTTKNDDILCPNWQVKRK